jgi:RHS repeat-associated protein
MPKGGAGLNRGISEKIFVLSNHLGNVLVTVSDRKLGIDNNSDGVIDYYTADVITANDYYPFGMDMPGRKLGGAARYGFNGKERDKDMNSVTAYDYGFRIYNPAIGKFLSVDPLTQEYPELTPYQFASNIPIAGIDLDGGEFKIKIWGVGSNISMNMFASSQVEAKMHAEKGRDPRLGFVTGPLKHFAAGITGGLVGADLMTGARVTSTVFAVYTASEVAGAFEHNRANTPEGRAAQDNRSKEHFTNAFLIWGHGKIVASTLTLFRGPAKETVKYLFRGTSEGYSGSNAVRSIGVTPTSSDPGVGTIFSVNSKNYGNGILQIALPEELKGLEATANVLKASEKEIAIGIIPTEFSKKVSLTITSDQARGILKNMGINIPARIAESEISNIISNTPKLTEKQIETFFKEAIKISQNGN